MALQVPTCGPQRPSMYCEGSPTSGQGTAGGPLLFHLAIDADTDQSLRRSAWSAAQDALASPT